jgi:hypothetical protein
MLNGEEQQGQASHFGYLASYQRDGSGGAKPQPGV